jgi:hypothetical protein
MVPEPEHTLRCDLCVHFETLSDEQEDQLLTCAMIDHVCSMLSPLAELKGQISP